MEIVLTKIDQHSQNYEMKVASEDEVVAKVMFSVWEINEEFLGYVDEIMNEINYDHYREQLASCVHSIGFDSMEKLIGKNVLYLEKIIVEEEYRGKQYGKKTMKEIEKIAKEMNIDRIIFMAQDISQEWEDKEEEEKKNKKLETWYKKQGYENLYSSFGIWLKKDI